MFQSIMRSWGYSTLLASFYIKVKLNNWITQSCERFRMENNNKIRDIAVICLEITMGIIININYSFYHVYMKKQGTVQRRLLNDLYGHLALWCQFGTLIIPLITLTELEISDWVNLTFLHGLRYTQSMVVLITWFNISVATLIHNFSTNYYLLISCYVSNIVTFVVPFVIRLEFAMCHE